MKHSICPITQMLHNSCTSLKDSVFGNIRIQNIGAVSFYFRNASACLRKLALANAIANLIPEESTIWRRKDRTSVDHPLWYSNKMSLFWIGRYAGVKLFIRHPDKVLSSFVSFDADVFAISKCCNQQVYKIVPDKVVISWNKYIE